MYIYHNHIAVNIAYNKVNREYEIINKRIDIDSKEGEGKVVHFICYF